MTSCPTLHQLSTGKHIPPVFRECSGAFHSVTVLLSLILLFFLKKMSALVRHAHGTITEQEF